MTQHAFFFTFCVLGLVAAALPQFAIVATASEGQATRRRSSGAFGGQAAVDSRRHNTAGDSRGTDDRLTTSVDQPHEHSQLSRRQPLETAPGEEVHFRMPAGPSDAAVIADPTSEEHAGRKTVPRNSERKRSLKDLLKNLIVPVVGAGTSYLAADAMLPSLTEQQQTGEEPLTTSQNLKTLLGLAAVVAATAFLGLGVKRTYRHFAPLKESRRPRRPALEEQVPEAVETGEEASLQDTGANKRD
ncbi:UNVERIFIED_CONTAM: dense granule protein GRA7 [Hammondia hammondi]|eukprot:XP_008884616.1 dense granule protein GRA7 [Hammondia hammondi]